MGIPPRMGAGVGMPRRYDEWIQPADGPATGFVGVSYRHEKRRGKEDEEVAPPPETMAKKDRRRDRDRDRADPKTQAQDSEPQAIPVVPSDVDTTASAFGSSKNILNPFTLVSSTLRIITRAPFFSLLTLGVLTIYIEGCRQLAEVVVLSSSSVSKRDTTPIDLSSTKKWLTSLLSDTSVGTTGVFFIVNLWNLVCVLLLGLLVSTTMARADSPGEKNRKAWWRNPIHSSGAALGGLQSTLATGIRVIAMDARLHGPITFFSKATWRTYLRITLFLLQLVFTILVTRQALSLAFMVGSGSDKAFDTGPDTASDVGTLATAAKSISPVMAFAMLNGLIGFVIITLAISWSALLHPKAPSSATSRGKGSSGYSPGTILAIKAIVSVVLTVSFVSILFFFSDIVTYADKNASSSYDVSFIGANLIFVLFIAPMGYALVVFGEVLGKVWSSMGCCRAGTAAEEVRNDRETMGKTSRRK